MQNTKSQNCSTFFKKKNPYQHNQLFAVQLQTFPASAKLTFFKTLFLSLPWTAFI